MRGPTGRTTICPPTTTRSRCCRSDADSKVLVVTEGNTYLEAALLLDEYLDVTDVVPDGYAGAVGKAKWDAVIFDRVTPAQAPGTNALYLDPRGLGGPVASQGDLKTPGFDKLDRKHPVVRFLALDAVNVSRGHRLVPQAGDKILGAADGGASPILVAGERSGAKFVALGFDVRDSDLPLRPAWPLFVLNCIDWFTDEDARYLSSYRTGEVWRVPVANGTEAVTVKLPDGTTQAVAVHDGRAVLLGERAGFYDLMARRSDSSTDTAAPTSETTSFAANLVNADESAIEPRDQLIVDGRIAGSVLGYRVGVRRDIWVVLLLIAAVLTTLEWATYHRRVTV